MDTEGTAGGRRDGFVILPDEVRPHAEALGCLLIVFSSLEMQLSIMLAVMLDIEFTERGDVVGGMEIRQKLHLLKSLGFVVGKDKPTDWYTRLCAVLHTIETDLCPARNRMVHDVWGQSDIPGALTRITLKPSLPKQTNELKLTHIPVSVLDIEKISVNALIAVRQIGALTVELKPSLMNKSLPRSPQQA